MEAWFTPPIMCPVLIGRAHDLTTLRLLVDRAKSSQGQVAVLSGEAGIGKSRLVAEVKNYAGSHDFLLVQGSCFPTDHAIPYAPLLDLLRSFLSSHPSTLPTREVESFAQAFLPLLPDLGHLLPSGTPPSTLPALDPEQEKRRRFETLAHFLTSQTSARPMLLVVEDLHWSDDTSLEFLHYLARRCAAHRLLLLLTYRSDELHASLRHFLAQLDRERLSQECSLARLTRDEVEAMLRAIFALPHSLRLELLALLYALTEGNPFFVEEVLTSLVATRNIFYANGHWERKELHELSIPRSVQDAVQQRTDRLSAPAQQVLTLAAVAGRRFDFALLQELTHHDEEHLLQLIKELIAAQLVVEESTEQFAFRHALTRQAIYADLLVRERKALHRTIADMMERLYRAAPETRLADLAYHFYEAGTWEKALLYAHRAGEQAQAMYAPRAAIEQVTRALDAAQRGSNPPPATLYRLRGQAHETLGDFDRARLDYETTLQMARVAGNPHGEWQALLDLGFLWTGRDYARAEPYFHQALERARSIENPVPLAQSLNRLGNWHLNSDRPLEALHYHQEALAIFQEANDKRGLAETLDLLGITSYMYGDLEQSSTYYQQAVALLRELDLRSALVSSLPILMLCSGNYQTETMIPSTLSWGEALRLGEQAVQLAREIEQPSALAYALCEVGLFLGPRGEYARALEALHEGFQIAEAIEHRPWMTLGDYLLGALYLDLLNLPIAQQRLERALAGAREIGSRHWILAISGFLALMYLLQQDLTRAEATLDAVLTPDAPSQNVEQRLVWAARADLTLARGDPGQALDITERLIASAANLSDGYAIPRLWKLRGEALAALQREAEAEAAFQAALVAARAHGLRPWLWRITAALGKLYQTQGYREEAEQACSTARMVIEELAAPISDEQVRDTFLERATAMLPQVRPLSPIRAAKQAFGGLTAREREVAALIAQGKINREIAEALVVSERTIETHVANIMFKLAVQSRRQIRAWAVEKGLISQH